jgi:hypothetical protein
MNTNIKQLGAGRIGNAISRASSAQTTARLQHASDVFNERLRLESIARWKKSPDGRLVLEAKPLKVSIHIKKQLVLVLH